jgi:hypothetical protein
MNLQPMRPLQADSFFSFPSDARLQLHFDDACFSIGAFASRRHGGILPTVFPASIHFAPRPGG